MITHKNTMKAVALITAWVCVIGYVCIDYMFPKEDTSQTFAQIAPQDISPKESVEWETTLIDSPETDNEKEVQVHYYVIVGSFGNLLHAQKEAEKLTNDHTDIIVLPPTSKGYYRIGYGKYSTHEEAEETIAGIRKNISSDAWVFSTRE
jgi:hypothetical protein